MASSAKGVARVAPGSRRMMVSLPVPLVSDIDRYARALRAGNKSGFVADAVRSYIGRIREARRTARLREAYAASAADGAALLREWEGVDEETWERIDRAERGGKA